MQPTFIVLWVLLPLSYATYIQYPANVTTCLGTTAVFDCAATDAQTIYYLVNGSAAINSNDQGVSVSNPIFLGNGITMVKLNAVATSVGITEVLCTILLVNNTYLNSAAYLNVQGHPAAMNLTAVLFNATFIRLTWVASDWAQSLPMAYLVTVKDESDTLVYNETVGIPQLNISVPNPCHHYEATVIGMCGTTPSPTKISLSFLGVPPSAPTNPSAAVIDKEAINLSWLPPAGFEHLSVLTYVVEIMSTNGTVVFHTTAKEPRLLLWTANLCDLNEAAISAKCVKTNETSTAASIRWPRDGYYCPTPQDPAIIGGIVGGIIGGIICCPIILYVTLLCIFNCCNRLCESRGKKIRLMNVRMLICITLLHFQNRRNNKGSYQKTNQRNNQVLDGAEIKQPEQITMNDRTLDLKDDTKLGREFKSFSVIGNEETAVVLRAESKDPSFAGKYYAIKITAKSTNDAVDKEARALTILDQLPGIVRYIDRWAEQPPKDWQNRSPWKYFADGAPVDCFEFRYQKTDYISEGNMEDWVLKEKIMGRKDIRSTFDQLARTMSDVHKLGVSHQDLCLQNIFVSKNPASEQIVFKIGGFTSPLLKEDASENNFVETCQKDIWSLGYILLQLMYFKKHHTLSHITSIHSEQQEMTQQFKELTADAKSVIKFFCGNDLCQSGFHNLSEALEHRTYKRWLKQCEQPSQRLMKQYDDMKPLEQISMEDASFLLNDDTRLGKEYKCFSVIRKEDKAVVLRAESKDPSICGKYYAIKITVKSTNDDDMDKEARALTILDQLPGIVRYIDRWAEQPPKDWQNRSPWKHFADDAPVDSFEFHYLKTDHFSEGNMKDWVAKEKIKDMNIIGSIFDELATTTSHIHKLGVSHCNLCLINIFVTMNPVSDQCDLKIGGFTSPLFKKDSVEEVFVGACQEDIWSLGCILLQLMYFRRHQTLPHITSNHSDQQEWVTQQFKELELTAALKSLIQIFCGNDLLGTQLQNLSQALVHPTYKKWMKQCEGV